MEVLDDIPFEIQKKQALTRRASKLIEWLERPEYSVYTGAESTTQLIKLIDLIIWALERSIPEDEWKPFEQELLLAKSYIADTFETPEQEIANFTSTIPLVISTLQSYMDYIK